ncbi:serpin-ZX-like, partial [Lotus japonicus]|uniref:serpin-ZX-like n=1 Tax=Lotus japonicus TaxID=34305 RepID=UPI00258C9FC9
WIEKETNGLIKELLTPGAVGKTTRLIFANALHFKAEWEHKFHAGCTSNYNFHLLNGTSVEVPFMISYDDQFIRAFNGFKVLRLSYKQGGADKSCQFSMYILLPDAKDGLSALIEKMASKSGFLEGKLPQRKVRVRSFMIPKFNFSFAFEASNVLKELGVVSPFSQSGADFTKMVDNPVDELYIESMFHKASINVNEEGTEAGASSSWLGPPRCIMRGIEFIADHPFLFLIREDLTGTILFVGQYYYLELQGVKMALEKSTRCQQDVALSFTKHLFSKQDYQNENIIFSPLSLHVALSVIAAGAQGGTLDELLSFLRSDSVDHLNTFFSKVISGVFSDNDDVATPPSHHLSFANGMWVDKSLSLTHSFKQLVATHYKATLDSVDFQNKADQVCDEVNSWVEKETNGLIKELLSRGAVNKETRLILANALHFKGEWEHKFEDALYSHYRDFHLLNGTSVSVPFMTHYHDQYIRAFDGFKVLRLSYKQGTDKKCRFSMYILLPDARDGLSDLIGKMASESAFLEGKLPQEKVQVSDFKVPRFEISFEFEASDMLKELGVASPFSQRDADFTKMVEVNSPLDELYVESIFQKAFIKVHENGTEAAAAAYISLRGGGGCTPPGIEFVADHPFIFLIREDFTGTILFVGQVLRPLGGADEATTPVKVDLGRKKRSGTVENAERLKKKSSDFKSEKNGEKKDGDDDHKAEVPPKRKRTRKND